ncbi:thioredoxin-like protein [Halteromyces radiatus]|uniref:thioredoxin-like protein n=1 Tax=Halteromyces radiatus TaxID=101107 RepID=UPI002220A216|nr:thioredoxin-like protein [Halteromyces radiatus]KAI8096364.1 thioredoxin-like protein [Halteromyces radiatus]
MAGKNILIKVTSDTHCPWCFIGKRRLEKAIEIFKTTHPGTTFEVTWFPFQLEPQLSREPIRKQEFFPRKFGAVRFQQMTTMTKAVGQPLGIQFSYEGVVSNSLDSHRLIHWSKQFNNNKQNQVVEELFKLYFEQDQDLCDFNALADAAERAGLDRSKTLAFLSSGDDTNVVKQLILDGQRHGVNSVPHIEINDKYTLSGAQDPETFIQVFEKVVLESQ